MNILVIGNGFDLAHGLPTKYTDFLKFVEVIRQVIDVKSTEELEKIDWKKIDPQIQQFIKNDMGNMRDNVFSQKQLWKELLERNFWIDYFLVCPMYQKENWIDFENEISRIIRSIDKDMKGKDFYGQIEELSNEYLRKYFLYKGFEALFENEHGERGGKQQITYKNLRDILINDLNRLIRALEIYLCEYVEKIKVSKVSPDIKELRISHVLSFNYTNTFLQLYNIVGSKNQNFEKLFDYIHGEANIENSIETNDMVLGIDEYLSQKRKNTDIDFIQFKKYYQRIYKGTGCQYKDWVDKIRESKKKHELELRSQYPVQIPLVKFTNDARHNLYIFGHSLDVTDKDIIRDLILNDNVYTTVYYFSKDGMDKSDLGAKITNLIKIIGQDELIRRTGGSTKTIEFRLQKNMV